MGRNRPIVTDEKAEFENHWLVQDFRKITDHFRGIYGLYLKLIKKKLKDYNVKQVGLGKTRVLADYARKSPWTLCTIMV